MNFSRRAFFGLCTKAAVAVGLSHLLPRAWAKPTASEMFPIVPGGTITIKLRPPQTFDL